MTPANRISDVVKPWAERLPDHLALAESGGSWSYRELDSVVEAAAAWLRELGIRAGDRVMIVGDNSRAFVALLLASSKLDAWPVLVNARVSAREVDEIREHCAPRRLFYIGSPHASDHAKRHGATIARHDPLGTIGIGTLNESAEPEALSGDISDRVAAVIYTSGTTGLPKGVMLTHGNLLFMAAGSVAIRSVKSEDRVYGILPMSHAVGLSVVLLGSLLTGATLYLASNFDPMSARVMLEREQITLLYGTPAIFSQMLQYAKLRKISSLKFPALRIVTSSGAPLDNVTKSATEHLFGMPLHNGYGITECSPTIALTRPGAPRSDLSIGPVFPGVEVRLLGSDHQCVADGEVGELEVRGPNIMKGYYRDPEATAAAVDAEGWFHTGDLARMEDGNLFIVGRSKDLIVRRGFYVYPAEVEAVLNSHPAVIRSAVVGRAVAGDEEVVAFVQIVPEFALSSDELADFAARSLVAYKRPSQILTVAAMPTTASGKIAKGELKKIAEGQSEERIGATMLAR